MPIFHYVCNNCGVNFSLIAKKNFKRMKPKCIKCGSRNIIKAEKRAHLRSICPNFI